MSLSEVLTMYVICDNKTPQDQVQVAISSTTMELACKYCVFERALEL